MIKRLIVLFCLLSLGAAPLQADNGWGLFGSYWAPADGESTFGVGAKIGFEILPSTLWDIRASWYDDLGDGSYELGVIPVETGLIREFPLGEKTLFSLGAGIGYYQFDATVISESRTRVEVSASNEVGYYGLIGLEQTMSSGDLSKYGAKHASIFIEVVYRIVEIRDVDVAGVSLAPENASLNGAVGTAGFLLRW